MTHELVPSTDAFPQAPPTLARSGMLVRVDDAGEPQEVRSTTLDQLLVATATGDRAAFSRFYDQTAPRVFGLVRRILVDAAQAEEVTQDVFLEAWQTAARYDPERGPAAAWLLTLAHRRAVDRVRSSQAARERDLRTGIRDLAIPVDDVAETAEIAAEHDRALGALGLLSPAQRECLALAYYEGCTQSEIAARLELPLGTVKTRIRDGMIRLRDLLGVRT